jgi:hypothetical protein
MNVKGDAAERKRTPIFSGVIRYFPKALAYISHVSWAGNEQHNPGKELFWDRTKSKDELDALTRHLVDAGTIDSDGIRHSGKLAWRALANLEKELEAADQQAETSTPGRAEDTPGDGGEDGHRLTGPDLGAFRRPRRRG